MLFQGNKMDFWASKFSMFTRTQNTFKQLILIWNMGTFIS
jgi:hypothetical protein